jgi:hypothetical protein
VHSTPVSNARMEIRIIFSDGFISGKKVLSESNFHRTGNVENVSKKNCSVQEENF